MVSVAEARAQIETRKQQVATAQRGIQARQKALPELGTQRALRMAGGIAGVPVKQRVRIEKEKLVEQKKEVAQYGEQISKYEKGVEKYLKTPAGRIAYAKERGIKGKPIYGKIAKWHAVQILGYDYGGGVIDWSPKQRILESEQKLYKANIGERVAAYKAYKAYKGQISDLEGQGFEAIYVGGKLTGFSDTYAKMSIPLEHFEKHIEQYAAPQVAYKDIFTGRLTTMLPDTSPAFGQIPTAVSLGGRELGAGAQARLKFTQPELFTQPSKMPTPSPEWSVQTAPKRTVIEKIKDLPAKGWEAISGRTPRETYGFMFEPEGRAVPGYDSRVYAPITTGKAIKDISRTAGGLVWSYPAYVGEKVTEKIPDWERIKYIKERKEIEGFYEKPSWTPKFGTVMPKEYTEIEWRPEREYKAQYFLGTGSKDIKTIVKYGIPVAATLAATRMIPTSIAIPAFTGLSAMEVVSAQKEISELEKQKIDISKIKAEIGERPADVLPEDWKKYESEYKAEIERYNKEIEESIASHRVSQAVGVAGVGLGAGIAGRQIVKYAKGVVVKPLPYKVSEPTWITPQVRVVDPATGKIITVGKPKIDIPIPAQKALVQKRWEKWLRKVPEEVEVTKAKVKYVWADKLVIEGKPALYYETRAVSPETLAKFKAGEIKLFVKPRIIGGPSAPTTLAELKELPKAQQEMWRRMATTVQEGTPASLERTPEILKKFQKIKGKTIEFSPLEPLGRKFKQAWTTTITKPVTEVTIPTEFGLVTRAIPKEAPFEIFQARTLMKDITKVTVTPARVVGKMPGVKEIIIRQKKIIGDEVPSKIWGITPTKIKKTPYQIQIEKMAPPELLPKPSLPVIKVSTPKVVTAPTKPSVITKPAVVSVWAGTGLYEKGEVGLAPGVVLGLSLIPTPEIESVIKIDTIPVQILKPDLKPSVRLEVKPILKPEIKPTFVPSIIPTIKPTIMPLVKPITKPMVKVAMKPIIKPVIKPVVKPVIKPTIRPTFRPTVRPVPPKPIKPTPIKPIVIIRARPKIKPTYKPMIKVKPQIGYEVEVKRKGKWVDVTPLALSKGEALALGRRETKAGAEVTFRLKEADGIEGTIGIIPITEAELKAEYRGRIVKGKEVKKPSTFIQKRKFRIKTKGEFAAITAKGIKKRIAKSKEIKWI